MLTNAREVNSVRNSLVGIIKQILILILNLVAKAIFVKSLGAVFVGINGLFTNIFLLLSFSEFGIGSVMAFSLYGPLDRFDKGEISTIYHFFRKIYLALSWVLLFTGLAVVPLLSFAVNTPQVITYVSGYYFLYLMGIIISNMFMYKSQIILADQKEYLLSFYTLIFEVSAILIQIYILLKTESYALFLVVFILKNALYAAAVSYKVNQLYPFLKDRRATELLSVEGRRDIYNKLWHVFGYRFARVFMTGTDNILISILAGTIWLGYYSNYDLIIVGITSLIATFYSGISASVGNLIAKESAQYQYSIFQTVQTLNMWIVGFSTTCLYLLLQDFLALWLGTEFVLDFKIVVLIIINYYLVCNRKSITVFREASGMFMQMMKMMFMAALINLVLSILLGSYLGLSGILLATMITALFTYYWYEPSILLKDKFSRGMRPFLKNQLETLSYTVVSIILTAFVISLITKVLYPPKAVASNVVTGLTDLLNFNYLAGFTGLANTTEVSLASFILKIAVCLVVPNIFYLFVLNKKESFKLFKEMVKRFYRAVKNR